MECALYRYRSGYATIIAMPDTPKTKKIPYHKKPDTLSLLEWQRGLRKQFVADKKQPFVIARTGGEHAVFADYTVRNTESGGVYKVALRSKEPGPNFCSCMDFKTNGLGTCKHIEAVLFEIVRHKKLRRLLDEVWRPAYSSLYLAYGNERTVMLRIGTNGEDAYRSFARKYFDEEYRLLPKAYARVNAMLREASRISSDFRAYEDAVAFIIQARQDAARKTLIDTKVNRAYLDRLLTAKLYPYQREGVLFAARAGRALIADEMGLGKTLQALGVAELLKKIGKVERVLIICPTSLKYQWKNEIERFTKSSVQVIEGNALRRRAQYGAGAFFFTIASYNVVGADREAIMGMEPDLVILDEAQRIKNWQTNVAREIKKIVSPYALVLTGTPIENKLEELYSIIQFIDPYRLGPLYRFLAAHQVRNETGKVIGYRDLNAIQEMLADIVIRRTKQQVLAELPKRTDKTLFVPMTEAQQQIHEDYVAQVVRLVSKWRRLGFLDEKDRQRLLIALNCMRMVADSTYILDQETRHDTKVAEVMAILDEVFEETTEKVVLFSQWERMTRLIHAELVARGVGFSYLHGGVPSKQRKGLIDDFTTASDCRVFLSTDAGGVGLNLQAASLLINMDIPWNPAVLEQRIGRIHRHGQTRNVRIINLVSKGSIEERILRLLRFKSSLFAGILDNGADEIFMGEDTFKRFMSSVEEVAGAAQTPVPRTDVEERDMAGTDTGPARAQGPVARDAGRAASGADALSNLVSSLSAVLADEQAIAELMSRFVTTEQGQAYLKVPIADQKVIVQAVSAITTLLGIIGKTSGKQE